MRVCNAFTPDCNKAILRNIPNESVARSRMKITTPNTNFGFFGWKASAEVSQAMLELLAGLGLLQILQRSPATEAEKKLANYEKRPKGFQRSSIEHNKTNEGI